MALTRYLDADYDAFTGEYRMRPGVDTANALAALVERTAPDPSGSRCLGVVMTRDGTFTVTATPVFRQPPPANPRDLPAEWSFTP